MRAETQLTSFVQHSTEVRTARPLVTFAPGAQTARPAAARKCSGLRNDEQDAPLRVVCQQVKAAILRHAHVSDSFL